MSAYIFENFIEICYETDKLNPLCCVSLDGYSWDAILEYPKIEFENIQETDLVLVFEIVVRGRITGFMGKRFLVSVDENRILDLDSNDLYGLGMLCF